VFGILAIVFASLNALGNAAGVAQSIFMRSTLLAPAATEPDPAFDAMRAMMIASTKIALGQGSVMLVMDGVLFVIGILLLKRHDLGRRLAIGWAVAAFVVLVGRALAFELVLMPALAPVMAPLQSSFMAVWTRLSTYGVLVFLAVFPVSLLVAASRLRRELS
jgi:hypothetical protein